MSAARDAIVVRAGLAALVALLPFGCNLILDAGDHDLIQDHAGVGAQPSVGGAGAGGADAGDAGPDGPEDAAGGSGGGCTATWSPGTTGAQAIACGQAHPIALTVDDSWVFFLTEGNGPNTGQLLRVSRDGGEVRVLVSGLGNPRAVRNYTGEPVMFTNDFGGTFDVGLFHVPKDGGDVKANDSDGFGTAPLAIVGGGTEYTEAWKVDQPVRIRQTGGGLVNCFPYTSSGALGGRILALTANTDDVYFAENSGGVAEIRGFAATASADGCAVASVTTLASDQTDVRAMARLDTRIYWITPSALRYKSTTEADISPPHEPVSGQHDLRGITSLTDGIVAVTSAGDGEVIRVDVDADGGTTKVLASGQAEPCGVTDYKGKIFWANREGGQIMRLDDWN